MGFINLLHIHTIHIKKKKQQYIHTHLFIYFSHLPFQPGLSCTVHIQPAVSRGSPQPPSVSQVTPETKITRSELPLLG